MSSFYDTLLATAQAYTKAHSDRDYKAVTALCSDSCIHYGGPKTVQQPRRNNEEYEAFDTEVFKLFKSHELVATDMIVDEKQRKVVVSMWAKGIAFIDVGEYSNEYVVTLTMTEDGTKVQDQNDFIDSHSMMDWIAKVGAFQDEFKERGEEGK